MGRMSEAEIQQMNERVVALYEQGKFAEAIPLAEQVAQLARHSLGQEDPEYATSLNNLAELYKAMGRYEEAEPLHLQAKEIRLRILGEEHPYYAASLSNLAVLYEAMGRYEEAEELLLKAKEIRLRVLGEEHPDYAQSLNNLAELYRAMGRYKEAERLHLQAKEIKLRVLGEKHPSYAASLSNLAVLYEAMGRYEEAEPLFLQAKEIIRRSLGEEHPYYATSLHNLAVLYEAMGRYEEAERLHLQAKEIRLRVLGEEHPYYAISLSNLAALYYMMGRYEEAEELLLKAKEISLRVLGEEHPDYAISLSSLAVLYDLMGRYEEAEPLFLQAKEIELRVLGEEHPNYAQSLHNLAWLYRAMGRYEEAEALYLQEKEIKLRVLGEEHPDYAASLNNLAVLLAATGRYADALKHFSEAAQIQNKLLTRIAGAYPEQQVLAFARTIEADTHSFVTLVWRYLSDDEEAVRLAMDLVLKRKAIAYEAASAQQQAALAGKYPQLQETFERLRVVRIEIARRALSGPARGETKEHYEQRMLELEIERERLERELAMQVPEVEFELRMRSADREAIASKLPPNSTLVEFFRFVPYRFEAKGKEPRWESERYIAFIIQAGEPERVQMIDLGEAEEIDELIARFRSLIAGEEAGRGIAERRMPTRVEEVCRNLHDRLFMPIIKAIGNGDGSKGTEHIIIAPDGQICLVPFEAFISPEGKFVIEDYLISYLTVGRDVMRFGEAGIKGSGAVIVADPDYDLHRESIMQKLADGLLRWRMAHKHPSSEASTSRGGKRLTREIREEAGRFERLPGTKVEGETVKRLLEEAGIPVTVFWVDKDALERPLKSVHKPIILHIATHGFFLRDSEKPVREQLIDMVSRGDSLGTGEGFTGLRRYIGSPLLRSGLVFAGINSVLKEPPLPLPEEAEDAILSALDVLTMDLMGTEIVTLSACQTALGDVHRSEGVIGLRRAFALAGAKTLVMSLWNVPDDETQLLMEGFYRRILSGMCRAEALRGAQLELIKRLRERDGYADPFFWSAFICQGDVAPIKREE